MATGKKGAKKAVGRVRRGDGGRYTVKMYYVRKPNGSYALRFKRAEVEAVAEEE